jgi:hypothetical protein
MATTRYRRVLQVSCVLALVALGLIAWSLVQPRPIPVIVAMSVAQAIGTASFLAFLWVVVADLRRGRVLGDAAGSMSTPPGRGP